MIGALKSFHSELVHLLLQHLPLRLPPQQPLLLEMGPNDWNRFPVLDHKLDASRNNVFSQRDRLRDDSNFKNGTGPASMASTATNLSP